MVTFTYAGIPPSFLHSWLIKGNERKNVFIELRNLRDESIPEESLVLNNVACVSFRLDFENIGSGGFISSIIGIQAETVTLYKDTLDNDWTHK